MPHRLARPQTRKVVPNTGTGLNVLESLMQTGLLVLFGGEDRRFFCFR